MSQKMYRLRIRLPRAKAIQHNLIHFLAGSLLLLSLPAGAEEATREITEKDRYRVELLLFTVKNPGDQEYMGQAQLPQLPQGAELLYGQPPGPGQAAESAGTEASAPGLKRFSKNVQQGQNLHLTGAKNRLQSSGRYNVEFLVAWNEAFPPGHKTPPLAIHVGQSSEGYSDIQGYVQIDRQRYLHVNAQLYDLELASLTAGDNASKPLGGDDGSPSVADPFIEGADMDDTGLAETTLSPDVVAWLRETRRMRSGEVHLLDSPTMGMLVYFEPLD